jgi:hypothetical protein
MAERAEPALPPRVVRGIELFNRGEFFECHEVLELEWKADPAPHRVLYQGMLQAAVTLHHVRRGNWQGATIMLRRALGHLEPFAPSWRGIDVAGLLDALRGWQRQLELAGPDGIEGLAALPPPRIRVTPPAA